MTEIERKETIERKDERKKTREKKKREAVQALK